MQNKQKYSISRMGLFTAFYLAVLMVILLVSSSTPFGITFADTTQDTIQKVTAQTINHQASYFYERNFIGQVEAKQTAMTGFEIGGLLKRIMVDEGVSVNQGDVLAELDTARLMAKKKEIAARLTMAVSNAELAENTFNRVVEANDVNAVSAQERDEANDVKDSSRAAVAVIEAELNSIQVDIDKTKLIAPFSGVVITRLVDEGTVVSAGQSILKIQQNSKYNVRVGVTKDVASNLTVGAEKSVQINDDLYSAELKTIIPLREGIRTVDAIFELNNQNNKILPGDVVRMGLDYQVEKSGFWMPLTALKEGKRGLWSLYVLSKMSDKLTVERRTVEVHYTDKRRSFVSGAVKDGERVVVAGANKLVPGQLIEMTGTANNAE